MNTRPIVLLLIISSVTACQRPLSLTKHSDSPSYELPTQPTQSGQISNDKSRIMEVQRYLAQKGYNPGPADGVIGAKTRAAIRKYQKDNHLPVDGLVTYHLLTHLSGYTPNNGTVALKQGKTIVNRCVQSGYQSLDRVKTMVFDSVIDELQLDVGSYLEGFCVPEDETSLTRLYIFLVSEGVIHSRLAAAKYYELVDVYEKAGIEFAVDKDALRRSTERLPSDIRNSAHDRMDGASALVGNGFFPDDNGDFQAALKNAYQQIAENSPYKKEARRLLAEVLSHSSSSAFYLTRSSFTIKKLTDYLGFDFNSGFDFYGLVDSFIAQFGKNVELAMFLLSKQGELNSMLVSSTYSIKALSQDINDIPRIPVEKSTNEVRELKVAGGFSLDELDDDFRQENRPPQT